MLAVAHAQRDEHAEAVAHLERAIALNPENRALARNDPDLEPLRDDETFRAALEAPPSAPKTARSDAGGRSKPNRTIIADRGLSESARALESRIVDTLMDVHVVVLAAGKGTRMKSALPKVLHRVAGLPLIDHVLATADAASARARPPSSSATRRTAASRRSRDTDEPHFVVQEPQLGTGHALLRQKRACAEPGARCVLLSGDVPLLTTSNARKLFSSITLRPSRGDRPDRGRRRSAGYGRIVRAANRAANLLYCRGKGRHARASGGFARSIRASTPSRSTACSTAIRRIGTAQRAARVLPAGSRRDLPERRARAWRRCMAADADEIRGINSRAELAAVSRIVREQKNAALMAAGVTIEDPATTYIDRDVTVGPDTIIHPGVSLEGTTTIGDRLRDSQRRADRQFADRRSRDDSQPLRAHRGARRGGRADRTVRAPPQGVRRPRERARRQFRRAEEDRARPRIEVDAPLLSRRHDDRRERQHRRRHHHLQLRRRDRSTRRSSRTARSSAATPSSSRR